MGYDWSKLVNEGAEAGLDGSSEDACPYGEGTRERELWLGGWHCAVDGTAATEARDETSASFGIAAE
jgi:ribosome modulation factor